MKVRMLSIIAAVMLAFSVSAAAEHNVSSDGGVGNAAKGEKPASQTEILAVNPGDTITIGISGATDKITLISYKGEKASSDNIQYLNQYPQDTASVSYTIRDIDDTQNGLYLLMINDGTEVSSFYYKVGRPVLENDEGVNYYKRVDFGEEQSSYKNTTSIAYLASFTPAGGTVSSYGFNVKKSAEGECNDVPFTDSSISGEAEFLFGITIYNIKADENVNLEESIKNLQVIPYVNYSENDA